MGCLRDEVILQSDQLLELGILFKPSGESYHNIIITLFLSLHCVITCVSDEVLRSLASVHKVLAVVIVRVEALRSLEEGRAVPELCVCLLASCSSC